VGLRSTVAPSARELTTRCVSPDPIGIPALFLLMMRQHSVHQLAYYKKARFVVLRLVKYVALSNAHVHAHVTTHSERTMFEDIPLPLLRRVAFTLLPPPLPSDQQGSRPMSPAPTVVIGVPSAMSTLSTSTGERALLY
jgi:hypothetical protein